ASSAEGAGTVSIPVPPRGDSTPVGAGAHEVFGRGEAHRGPARLPVVVHSASAVPTHTRVKKRMTVMRFVTRVAERPLPLSMQRGSGGDGRGVHERAERAQQNSDSHAV